MISEHCAIEHTLEISRIEEQSHVLHRNGESLYIRNKYDDAPAGTYLVGITLCCEGEWYFERRSWCVED